MEQNNSRHSVFLNCCASNATFDAQPDTTKTKEALWQLQLCCLVLIIITGGFVNALVCKEIAERKKRRSNEYFVLNLAITDLGACLISVPFDVAEKTVGSFPSSTALCKTVYPFQTVLQGVSVCTLFFMGVERCRAIVTPFRRRIRERTAVRLIVSSWLFCVVLVVPYAAILEMRDGNCVEHWQTSAHAKAYTLSLFTCLFAAPLFVITLAYTLIVRKLHLETKRSHALFAGRPESRNAMATKLTQRNVKTMKVLIIAVVVFAACLLPNHVMWLLHDFASIEDTPLFNTVLTFSQIAIYFNSVLNPFIFGRIQLRHCFRGAKNDMMVRWKSRLSFRLREASSYNEGVRVRSSDASSGIVGFRAKSPDAEAARDVEVHMNETQV